MDKMKSTVSLGEQLAGDQYTGVMEKFGNIDEALADTLDTYVFDEVFGSSPLDYGEVELCIISSLVVQNHVEQLDFHFSVARRADVSPSRIFGVILHCIPFSGWPKGANAITAFMNWLESNGLEHERKSIREVFGDDDPDYDVLGCEQGGKIYADYRKLLETVSGFEPGLDSLVTRGIFGRFYGRRDLTLRERQLTAVAILTSLARLPQLASHIKGAFLVGCKPEEVRYVIKLMHLYAGWPATLNALTVLADCTKEDK